MLPGAHRVRAKLAKGYLGEYWYAWRGGPRILYAKAATEAGLRQEVARLTPSAKAAFDAAVKPPPAAPVLDTLITDYLAKGPIGSLAPRTMSDLRKRLDAVRLAFGEMPINALKSPGARKVFLDWRAEIGKPHTADAQLAALDRVLAWSVAVGDAPANPLKEEWPRLYKPTDHADAIWAKADLITLLKGADIAFRSAVLLSIYTGLRGSDLVRLDWSHVGKEAITLATAKSRGRRVVTIPITPPLRALLAKLKGKEDRVGPILLSAHKARWSFSGLQTAMQRRKAAIGMGAGLRWHDLRGTAATRLIRAGLPVHDVALILGWEPKRAEALASYVNAEAVAAGMLARLRSTRRRT